MSLVLLLGGVRSGKSRLAGRLVGDGPGPVTLIATAECRDQEMRERILAHQRERPRHWSVVEEPVDLEAAIGAVGSGEPLIVDCLTLWVSNLLGSGVADEAVEQAARRAAARAAARSGPTIVVSNEVGSGIVPMNELARRYRDLLGRVNSVWAEHSDRVFLTVAGGVVPVRPLDSLWETGDD